MVDKEHVKGEDKGKIILYALSTCVWCKKTKNLLKKLDVDFSFIYVDKLDGEDKEKIMEEVKKYNPRTSFPTVVLNDEKVITGFKENEIIEALEK